MGRAHERTMGGTFRTTIGRRNTVPSTMARIVALGLGQACLSLYSTTRSSFGVMVAHLTPTPQRLIASAAWTVTRSSVRSRSGSPRS